MQKYDIHVCLVSDQAAPNFLPVLDERFKPENIVLIVSNEMKEKKLDEYLTKGLKQSGIKNINTYSISDCWDFEVTSNELLEIITEYLDLYQDKTVAFNITGGTKVMALAAYNIADLVKKEENKSTVFYVNTEKEKIHFPNNRNQDFKMNPKLSVVSYFSIYGFNKLENSPKYHKDQVDILSDYFIKYAKTDKKDQLCQLNGIVHNSKNNKFQFNLDKKSKYLEHIFNDLTETGLIIKNGDEIYLKNEEVMSFIAGGWLEYFIFNTLTSQYFRNIVDDIENSLTLGHSGYNPKKSDFSSENLAKKNEFDIALIANKKIHIIEVKATKQEDDFESYINKLNSLARLSGSMAKPCLISYNKPLPKDYERAKQRGVHIIAGLNDLQQIKTKLIEWINGN